MRRLIAFHKTKKGESPMNPGAHGWFLKTFFLRINYKYSTTFGWWANDLSIHIGYWGLYITWNPNVQINSTYWYDKVRDPLHGDQSSRRTLFHVDFYDGKKIAFTIIDIQEDVESWIEYLLRLREFCFLNWKLSTKERIEAELRDLGVVYDYLPNKIGKIDLEGE
jgi:hypothetical protein